MHANDYVPSPDSNPSQSGTAMPVAKISLLQFFQGLLHKLFSGLGPRCHEHNKDIDDLSRHKRCIVAIDQQSHHDLNQKENTS